MRVPGIPELLKEHARTFALTLRLLPRDLREPLEIAYLLARISDTVADSGVMERAQRIGILEGLKQIQQAGKADAWKPTMPKESFTLLENELLAALPQLLKLLDQLPDREEILALWGNIIEGQLFDLRWFAQGDESLPRAELERYCYLVAGSVGESWTRLIGRHAPEVLTEDLSVMIPLGCSYGKGLQLVNILRDRADDRAIGRRYFRKEEEGELYYQAKCWLADGNRFLSRLRPGRILYATALPYELALPTIRAIRSAGESGRAKIFRSDVFRILATGLPSLWLPRRGNRAS
jgi:farnesyl-diphosphate farnesyltransferase